MRHFGAEAADVDWGVFGDEAFFFEAVEHAEDFLGFAHGEDGDEDRSFACDDLLDGLSEIIFLGGAVVVWVASLCAASGFYDEGVDGFFGEKSSFLEGAVFEVDVAGVHHTFVVGLDGDADGAEDMACVVERGEDIAVRIEVEGFLDVAFFKVFEDLIELVVFEERVFRDAVFHAFRLHDIDGVVEHGLCEVSRFRGEEDLGLRLLLEEDGKGADVIEVRVGDDDGVSGALFEEVVVRDGFESFVFWVHACVENHFSSRGFQYVRICADSGVATEAFKNHEGRMGKVGCCLLR